MDIVKLIDNKKLVNWRRHLHMYPEIGFNEHETTKYIAEQIAAYPGIEVLRPTETGLVAVLKGGKPGKIIGLRADIDALPILEEADVEFKSKNPGIMHACGHDCHAAMLLGAVDALYKIKESLHGTIKFIFQHAEEVFPGGAKGLIASGVLDDVEAFYGCHVGVESVTGTVGLAAGPVYANADSFSIKIQGRGSHAAGPQASIDPLLIGTEIVQALNFIVSRNIAPHDAAVVTVASFNAGTAHNIIPDTAKMLGTARSYKAEVRDLIESRIKGIAHSICRAYGATCEVEYQRGYNCVVNDEGLHQFLHEIVPKVLPDVVVDKLEPRMGGEDFSEYATIAPAFFARIGAATEGKEYLAHHPGFTINEGCLPIGSALYTAFAAFILKMSY